MPKNKAKVKAPKVSSEGGPQEKITHVPIEDYNSVNQMWDNDRRGRLTAERTIFDLQAALQQANVSLDAARLAATGLQGDTQYSVPVHLISKLREIAGFLAEASIGNSEVGRACLRVQALVKDLEAGKLPEKVRPLIEAIHIGSECAKLRMSQLPNDAMENIFWERLSQWL